MQELSTVRSLFTKSVVVRDTLQSGHVLTKSDLVAKKPGTGIPAARLIEFIGRKLVRAVDRDHLLTENDVEG